MYEKEKASFRKVADGLMAEGYKPQAQVTFMGNGVAYHFTKGRKKMFPIREIGECDYRPVSVVELKAKKNYGFFTDGGELAEEWGLDVDIY
jgi:hypothetical protein